MNELIKLTPTEQFLQNTNMTITLKEIADKYGKENSKLVKSFEQQIGNLTDDRFESFDFWVDTVATQTGTGRIQNLKTYSMNVKTMVWFVAKFDANLRADVINYAFEKLEKEKSLAVKEAKKPIVYHDGRTSVRRCISEAWEDSDEQVPNESDIWDALIWKGFAMTKAKVTTTKIVPSNLEGHIGAMKNRGFATYHPDLVRQVWEEFELAGKPVKSETERLTEEFEKISKYYEEKLREAKS